jgi:uncharacterized protein YcgI (DUF1989 family)
MLLLYFKILLKIKIMKKIIYIIALLGISAAATAQKLTVSTTNVSVTVKQGVDDAEGHFDLTNTAATAKKIHWDRLVPCVTGDWQSAICDEVCWIPTKGSNDFTLEAGKTINMVVHVYPDGKEGSAVINLNIFEATDPTNKVAVSVKFNTCASGLNDREIAGIQLSPNPTQSFFRLSDNALVHDITIVNALGQEVATFDYAQGTTYDVSAYAKGLYFVRLRNENGKVLKTEKLQIQ